MVPPAVTERTSINPPVAPPVILSVDCNVDAVKKNVFLWLGVPVNVSTPAVKVKLDIKKTPYGRGEKLSLHRRGRGNILRIEKNNATTLTANRVFFNPFLTLIAAQARRVNDQ